MTYTRWPAPGETVTLQVDGQQVVLVAVVDDLRDGSLLVREPYDPAGGTVTAPVPGSTVQLRWTNEAGKHSCEGLLRGVQVDRVPLWELPVQERRTSVEQRREHVRVADALPVQVRTEDSVDDAVVCDLSEGGARCVVHRGVPAEPGDELVLEMVLEGQPVRAQAVLLAARPLGEGRTELRLRFVGLGAVAAVLRRRVMHQQCRARTVRR